MRELPDDLPPLRIMPKEIPAACYNRVRLALIRLGKPLRIGLTRHRGLEIVLDDEAWCCVDSFAEDQLIMVWRTFSTGGRDNLTEPVACELFLYHHCAGLVMGSVLSDMEQAIEARLAPNAPV
ncbi:MAG TPA: hypothetical protein VF501_02770 [Thiobacillus sp.]